jgi:hypothetical protein
MSIVALKRKTNAVYSKTHSHGRNGESGFSINGSHRALGYIGKDKLMSNVITPFRGALPMGLDGSAQTSYVVQKTFDVRASQSKFVNPSVNSSRAHLNMMRWCCQNIVRTQSGIDLGSQDLYIARKSAANVCVVTSHKPKLVGHACKGLSNRLDCANNYTKDVNPVDSSIRTLALKTECALSEVDTSKLFISNRIKRVSC